MGAYDHIVATAQESIANNDAVPLAVVQTLIAALQDVERVTEIVTQNAASLELIVSILAMRLGGDITITREETQRVIDAKPELKRWTEDADVRGDLRLVVG